MKRTALQLDYIQAPRRMLWPGLLLLVLALLAAAHLGLRWREARTEINRIETTRSLVNAERPRAKAVPMERLDEHVKAAETVVRQLTLPWAPLIETLENVAVKDVAVLHVQPDAQQRNLRITAEARNANAMWQYVHNLTAAKTLTAVHLVNHQVQAEDPQKPLQFSVQASFKASP